MCSTMCMHEPCGDWTFPTILQTTDTRYGRRLSGATTDKCRRCNGSHTVALSIYIMSAPKNQRLQVDQTSTLGESYMPPAEPQQFKVAPATWAFLGLRQVQVYAVT